MLFKKKQQHSVVVLRDETQLQEIVRHPDRLEYTQSAEDNASMEEERQVPFSSPNPSISITVLDTTFVFCHR